MEQSALIKNERTESLNDSDCSNLGAFLSNALDDFKKGVIDKEKVTSGIVGIIRAIDECRYADARMLLAQGRALLHTEDGIISGQ